MMPQASSQFFEKIFLDFCAKRIPLFSNSLILDIKVHPKLH